MAIKKVITFNWNENTSKIAEDFVCIEENYELYINNKFISNLTASPNNLKELGVGYVISEGYLESEDIKDVHIMDAKITVIAEKIK